MVQCPYYDNKGFCAKSEVISIDQLGMCSVLWKKGQQRVSPMSAMRKPIMIIDAKEDEVRDVTKEESKEEAGSRLENPISEAAASNNECN